MAESLNIGTERTHDVDVVGILDRKTCTEQVRVCDLQKQGYESINIELGMLS